jgi:hypothetical protein
VLAATVIYFLHLFGANQLRQTHDRFFKPAKRVFPLIAIVPCWTATRKGAILPCGKAVNQPPFVRRNTTNAEAGSAPECWWRSERGA